MPNGRYPINAIVSIWHKEVLGKGTFLGSGVFISPRLVLTAKHVVDQKESSEGFYLGLVDGYPFVPAKTIHVHPDFDIALVDLEKEFANQTIVRLAWDSTDLTGKKVDFYGINKYNKARDQHKDHTVGTWYYEKNGYLCDHRILEGFSGGGAFVGDLLVGVIIERHESDQQSLFVPLYLAYEWFKTILPKTTLEQYFPSNPPSPASLRYPMKGITTEILERSTELKFGEVKYKVCSRLGQDWQDLADILEIPIVDRARFDKGREPHKIWEWLESRGKLGELEQGLRHINRSDLANLLPKDFPNRPR